jgi:hypothetical protein
MINQAACPAVKEGKSDRYLVEWTCDFWAMSLNRECQRLNATPIRGNDTRASLAMLVWKQREKSAQTGRTFLGSRKIALPNDQIRPLC